MQPTCSNCHYPLQPGNVVCTNCGTPVSSVGGGSYDPTIRAGTPPGTGYGQPPYGAPPAPDPYGVPTVNPNPYGTPQPNAFGAPPSSPYGSPPAAPGYSGPPPFGAPTGYPGGQFPPPQQKSRKGLYLGLGIGGIVLVALIIGCIVVVNLAVNTGKKVVNSAEATATALAGQNGTGTQGGTGNQGGQTTTGPHITKIQTGTGFDQNSGAVIGETSTFTAGSDAWVVYTVKNDDPNGTVQLKLYNNGNQTDQSNADKVDTGTNVYANQLTNLQSGPHKIEIYYSGTLEASITFNVTG